jgi:hypothetical protein
MFHVDRNARASLALDLMGAVRPYVDAYVLALVCQRTLSARDFAETRRGVCRILPALAKTLAETTTTWARQVAPVASVTGFTADDCRRFHRYREKVRWPSGVAICRSRSLQGDLIAASRQAGESRSRARR